MRQNKLLYCRSKCNLELPQIKNGCGRADKIKDGLEVLKKSVRELLAGRQVESESTGRWERVRRRSGGEVRSKTVNNRRQKNG